MKVWDIEQKSSEYDAETRTNSVGEMVLIDLLKAELSQTFSLQNRNVCEGQESEAQKKQGVPMWPRGNFIKLLDT